MFSRLTRVLCTLVLAACTDDPAEIPGTQLRMSFAAQGDFLAAPFPSDHLSRDDGTIDVTAFPNPRNVGLVRDALAMVTREARGFAATAGIFFSATAPLAESRLPDLAASVSASSNVVLMDVTEGAPTAGRRHPIEVRYADDAGPFGGSRLLSLLPLQGMPLRAGGVYAAFVLRGLGDAVGRPLDVPRAMAELARGQRPLGMATATFSRYRRALSIIGNQGIDIANLAALTVFRVDSSTGTFDAFTRSIRERPLPVVGSFVRQEAFEDYCVYSALVNMPVYQAGTPPYFPGPGGEDAGGDWRTDAASRPIHQRDETARVVITIPRRTIPEAGIPLVVFVRTGGGGDRPLVDRGPRAVAGGEALAPGTGPALHFARAGFAGLSVDGPHGGRRNATGGDEQLLMFNFTNPRALRDNVRQSALELLLIPDIAARIEVDTTDCEGARRLDGSARARFDTTKLGIMGHSMGAFISPLTMAFEPRYRFGIWSGAGASWIENVRHKKKPLDVRSIAELLLSYPARTLRAHDPVLTLLQWAAEGADPAVYLGRLVRDTGGAASRHLLMIEGIIDRYNPPRIANVQALAAGLDLAGDSLDDPARLLAMDPAFDDQIALESVLPFVGRGRIDLPASANVPVENGMFVTAAVLQFDEDGIEDGHEAAFQVPAARRAYRCFLESFLRGTPRIPAASADLTRDDAPCDG
jgi:hypothetical protein